VRSKELVVDRDQPFNIVNVAGQLGHYHRFKLAGLLD
jgi:hypothetical protein